MDNEPCDSILVDGEEQEVCMGGAWNNAKNYCPACRAGFHLRQALKSFEEFKKERYGK